MINIDYEIMDVPSLFRLNFDKRKKNMSRNINYDFKKQRIEPVGLGGLVADQQVLPKFNTSVLALWRYDRIFFNH
ncbi:hypothetical protein HanHA300_Chr07g0242121 [Helianthus annuus]|nr:hypothetical protein HanHA300_Chr07g0242121 [Helianthus annuus]KAJ0563103.1 hypothetical protein HanHA89_Chr07g0259311 [Helianthus annuus]KAJ0728471.1 hypothetical protein HanLR1_Chr07g0242001 [Helianthus annuus]